LAVNKKNLGCYNEGAEEPKTTPKIFFT
jgi:hypothetical protein